MARQMEYIRLPGRRRVTIGFSRNSLWLGKDHVLHVINRGYSEEYRRFYYRDIQAIFLRQTSTGRAINIILGIFAATNLFFLTLGYLVWGWESFALVPLSIATFLWFLLFLFYASAGPTCVCHLRTAVQFESLPSLHRVKSARKAIAMLRDRIESHQGSFASEAPSP